MKRILRVGLFGLPWIALVMGTIAACSDDAAAPEDDAGVSTADAAVDGAAVTTDAAFLADAGDAGVETDSGDAATLPPLCLTYTNAGLVPDAAAGEGDEAIPRWDLVAYRALEAAALTCEVGGAFADNLGDPTAYECLGLQLADLLACPGTITYSAANDSNGSACAPDAGSVVQLGFRNPGSVTYTLKDVDYFIGLVAGAAAGTGVAQVDVARLIAILESHRKDVVGDEGLDAGPDGGAFSQSTCP